MSSKNPNLKGLSTLSKTQLIQKANYHGLVLDKKDTILTIKEKLKIHLSSPEEKQLPNQSGYKLVNPAEEKDHPEFHNYSEDFDQAKLKFINYQLNHNIKVPENSLINKFIDRVNTAIRPLVLSNSSKYQYVGPSTDLFNNMRNNVLPYNNLDALALEHDIEYLEIGLLKNKEKLTEDDKREIRRLQSHADDKMTRGIDLLMKEQLATNKTRGANEPSYQELSKVKRLLLSKQGLDLDFVGTTEPLTENERKELKKDRDLLETKRRPLPNVVSEYPEKEYDEYYNKKPKGGLVSEYSDTKPKGGLVSEYSDTKPKEGIVSEYSESDEDEDEDEEEAKAPEPGSESDLKMKTVPINIINKKENIKLDTFVNKTATMRVGDQIITGDRGMRADIAGSIPGSYVKLNRDEKARNIAFYSSLNFVKTGFGNGNQQILPFSYDGWSSKNKLFDAVKYNEHLQFSGRLNLGDQYIRRDKKPTLKTLHQHEVILTPTIQLNQKPEAYVTQRKVGEPIQMASEPHSFGMYQRRYAKECRLFNPNVVNGQRL